LKAVTPPVVDAEITSVVEEGVTPKAKRATRARKSAAKTAKASKSPRASKSSKGKAPDLS
jgi:hypothetical protein